MTPHSRGPPRPAVRSQSVLDDTGAAGSPPLEPIASPDSFKSRAYAPLKDALLALDVYPSPADIRLDARRPALDFGISPTPGREPTAPLQRQGFLPPVPPP